MSLYNIQDLELAVTAERKRCAKIAQEICRKLSEPAIGRVVSEAILRLEK